MYVELAKILLSAAAFRAVNVFGWRSTSAYVSLSAILLFAKPGAYVPEKLLLYTAGVLAAYVSLGIIMRLARRQKKKSGFEKKHFSGNSSLTAFLPITTIGYAMAAAGTSKYVSLAATWTLFWALGRHGKNKVLWVAMFGIAAIYSAIFSRIEAMLYPVLYGLAYIFITAFFSAAKDSFAFACKPKDLRTGMVPAETIVFDGRKYRFSQSPFPTLTGIFSYAIRNKVFGKRVVASFFSPLKKESIAEIRKIAKEYKKPVIFIQKRMDFVPFLLAGTMIVFLFS